MSSDRNMIRFSIIYPYSDCLSTFAEVLSIVLLTLADNLIEFFASTNFTIASTSFLDFLTYTKDL